MLNTLLRFTLKSSVALGFVGLLGAGTIFLHERAETQRAEASLAPDPIAVMTLVTQAQTGYEITDRFVGRLEPAQHANLSFERGGLVTDVLVEEGTKVGKGDLIAELDTALLAAERDRLLGQRKQILAQLELARLTTERQKTLQQRGHASSQQLDEARLAGRALEGQLIGVDAAIRRIEIDIEKAKILAPFAGTIGARMIDNGAVIDAGAPVVSLLETDRPQARIGVSPTVAQTLEPGRTVALYANDAEITGEIVTVRPDLSTATRTTSVLIDVLGNTPVKFGDTIELHVSRKIPGDGFWVPTAALSEGARGLWTVLTVKDSAAQDGLVVGQEAVEILHIEGARVYVRGTLEIGQRIIAAGRNRVIPGQMVVLADAN